MVKQGTETSESSLQSTAEMPLHSDDVRIEKFSLDEKQRRLRQALISRCVCCFRSTGLDYNCGCHLLYNM